MSQPTKNALSVFALVILAGAFWLLLISPKKNTADELQKQVSVLQSEVSTAREEVATGVAAKKSFPSSYQQLILLGKAVPVDAATASLMVQLDAISTDTSTPFEGIELKEGGGESEVPTTETEGAEAENVDALPPLGSSPGPAGLRAMPYELSFVGGFFDAADFISKVDSLVQTKDGHLYADGRLLTFDSFEMSLPSTVAGPSYKHLDLKFHTTAYATPFGQGLTAGASSAGPELE